jgi:hypothetical protein
MVYLMRDGGGIGMLGVWPALQFVLVRISLLLSPFLQLFFRPFVPRPAPPQPGFQIRLGFHWLSPFASDKGKPHATH